MLDVMPSQFDSNLKLTQEHTQTKQTGKEQIDELLELGKHQQGGQTYITRTNDWGKANGQTSHTQPQRYTAFTFNTATLNPFSNYSLLFMSVCPLLCRWNMDFLVGPSTGQTSITSELLFFLTRNKLQRIMNHVFVSMHGKVNVNLFHVTNFMSPTIYIQLLRRYSNKPVLRWWSQPVRFTLIGDTEIRSKTMNNVNSDCRKSKVRSGYQNCPSFSTSYFSLTY